MKVSRKALLAILSALIAVALVPVLAYAGPSQLQGSNLSVGTPEQGSTTFEAEGTLNLIQSGDYHPETKGTAGHYSKRSSNSLSSEQEAALRSRLTMCFASRQANVDLVDLGIVASDKEGLAALIAPVISDVVNSNPDLFYVDNSFGYSWQNWEESGTLLLSKVSARYEYDLDDIDAMVANYEQSIQVVLSWVPENATEAQQAKAVHDWLVYNCSYNTAAANAGSSSYENMNPWNAYGALVDKRPVCQGYSLAFIAVMNRLGIPCTFVTQDPAPGDSAGHGWNRIEIDGKWYNLDVTWDDPVNYYGQPISTYFLKSDQWFRNHAAEYNEKYHTQWEPEGVPGTDTTYDNVQDWPVYSGPASNVQTVTSFELPQSVTLEADGSQVLAISSIAPEGVNADLARARASWLSSDESIVYIDSFGKVYAGSVPGTAVVTCEIDGVSRTCSATVSDPLGLQAGEIGGKLGTCKWVLSADHTTLTVSPYKGDEGMFYGRPTAWNEYRSEITTVAFTGTIQAVGSLGSMFYGYTSLESADLSGLDTSAVTSMNTMFYNCESLTSIDVSGFNTANVTDMQWMFGHCKSLLSLDASKFDTSCVTDMNHMFYNCLALTALDISSFDTSSLATGGFGSFIDFCHALSELKVGEGYTTSQAGESFFPTSTSSNGKWWSTADGSWYAVNEITANRMGVADLYANYEHAVEPITFGHNLGSWVVDVEPTCAAEGQRHRSCSNCDYTETESIAVLSHTWASEYTVDEPATCIAPGSESIHCSVCGASDASTTRPIPPAGHSWPDEYTVDVEPTCTEAGSESIHCSVCGASDASTARPVAAKGHAYGDWVVTKAASCTAPGERERTCSRCSAVETGAVPALGHDYVATVTDPTCTAGGYTTHTCSRCGDSYVDSHKDALGHDYVATVTDPTCTLGGYTTHTCSRCQDSYVDSHEGALGHELVKKDAKKATCIESGNTEHYECSRCKALFLDAAAESATTSEAVTLGSTGHDWEDWSVATPATCTADGVETRVCRYDATHKETRSVKATGHRWDSGKITKPATYSSTGVRTFTCSTCGSTRTETIPMLARTSISSASVSIPMKATYAGEAITPSPTVKVGSKTLVLGADYMVTYKNNTDVGKSATVVISGKGAYSGTKSVTFEIAKASNTATPKKTKVKKAIKAKSLKKKAKTVALPKVETSFGEAKWKVAKKDRKKVLTLKGGKVKVKKGAKAGTYTIKLRAVVAGTANYASAKTKVVTVKVTVN